MPNYSFSKIFIEARYSPALFFNDMNKIQLIADELIELFPIYTFEPNQKALVLNNIDKHYAANILANRFILDVDEPINFDEFKEIADKFIYSIITNLNIKTMNRIGMRTLRGMNKKNIGEANNFIKNLFKFDDLLFNKLGSDINNLGITFSFRSDDYTIAVNIRSNSMQTIEMKDNAMVRNETVNQVLVDSDVFLEGTIDIDTVSNRFINDVIKINNNKIDNFIKNVSIY